MSFTPSRASHCLLDSNLVSSSILPTYYLNPKDQHKSNNFHLPSLTPNSTSNPQSVSRSKPLVVFTPPPPRQLPLLRLPPPNKCPMPTSMAACIIISSYLDVC
ncbi:hypothetical protein NA56DRAFT_425983 [Hyaloscypha hepaticicola]|uniref:Uncharacterized protein n=1 Tax=Hyaloscypha hepaticicola TaxID=2082293 RepID=A0A2J6QG31_9HELO|nr:hypothetical protein NA56DRAFT_425983 [Hyaloscypha hepaticicola]